MAVANNCRSSSSSASYTCYKVSGLIDTILDSKHTARLEDRYLLGEQLGWGQFGVIRACSDKLTGEVLACKSIAKDRLVTEDDICSVKLEIEIMARLSGHPNIVGLKVVYEEENFVHLLMELCAGGELFHRLEKHGRFKESQARVLFTHLMEVVMYCHQNGIVHRDLKPENILLATTSPSSPIKLADFGLATYYKPGQSLHGTVGSPFYIAPEVLSGGYNEAADVWSAGVILYILLSGMPPFWGKTKSRIFDAVRAADLRFPCDPWDHISPAAKDLIKGMLCTDPAKRLTAAQVLDHSWIKNCDHHMEIASEHSDLCCGQLDLHSGCCSSVSLTANRDLSFGFGYPEPLGHADDTSPVFTCKSSFSSFLVEATPCSASANFSFSSCESGGPGLCSPIPSMPSFSFFSPYSTREQEDPSALKTIGPQSNAVRDANSGSSVLSTDTSACLQCRKRDLGLRAIDVQMEEPSHSRGLFGIHSRRNLTIGLGELEHLHIMVTESVSRWASCTQLPTAPSLRSSLVC